RTAPPTSRATAERASRGPIAAAASSPVAPSSRSSSLPSGSEIRIVGGSIQTAWYPRAVQATVVTLAIIMVALAALLWRERQARRRAAAEADRLRRESAPRELLSRALWSRDAIMAAVSGPVLLLDADGVVVRAN